MSWLKQRFRGIRIIADFTINHVHEDHIYFQNHPEWFNEDACAVRVDVTGPKGDLIAYS